MAMEEKAAANRQARPVVSAMNRSKDMLAIETVCGGGTVLSLYVYRVRHRDLSS